MIHVSRWWFILVWLVVTAVTMSVAYGWLTYGGMAIIDLTVLVSSLTYQVVALPWEILRNWRAKAVNKVSYGMAFVGTVSYTSSTLRALVQPDWVDVGSRWMGMICSLVIAIQIIHYDRVRLSFSPPFIVYRAFDVQAGKHLEQHTTGYNCKACGEVCGHRIEWAVKCGKCAGPVHCIADLSAPRSNNYTTSRVPLIYLVRCASCARETRYITISPYPPGVSYWLWIEGERWRKVTPDEYIEIFGSEVSYIATEKMRGAILRAGARPPIRYRPSTRSDLQLAKRLAKARS